MQQQTTKKICIVGAGPSGIMAARHLSEIPNTEITVFEAGNDIGGLWNYNEKNASDLKYDPDKRKDLYYHLHKHFHGSLYPYLMTNVPYFFMSHKDFSHVDLHPDIPLFINIAQHKEYLDAYITRFDLRHCFNLNTLVQSVRLYKNLSPEEKAQATTEERKFVIKTATWSQEDAVLESKYSAFDYVVLCTGHNSKPYIPPIKGISKFTGKIIPTKDFRNPEAEFLKNHKILVLGAGMSAIDIVVQLLANPYLGPQNVGKVVLVGRKVDYLAKAKDFEGFIQAEKLSIIQGEIEEVIGEKQVKITDGSIQEVDTILLGTGYQFSLPFLDFEKDKLVDFDLNPLRKRFFGPVYKRLVCIREPDLFFVGFTDASPLNLTTYELQTMIVKYIIEGKLRLPSKEDMVQGFLKDLDEIRWKHKRRLENFKLSPLTMDIEYRNELRDWLRPVHKHDEEKSKEYERMFMETYKKMGEMIVVGNYISFKKYDYHTIFPRSLKNSTDLV